LPQRSAGHALVEDRATPMIGQNDDKSKVFSLSAASSRAASTFRPSTVRDSPEAFLQMRRR
jgi:hypothetical protein